MNDNKLTRIIDGNELIGGVCNGLSEYFGADITLVRMAWIVSMFVSLGASIFVYFIMLVITPEENRRMP